MLHRVPETIGEAADADDPNAPEIVPEADPVTQLLANIVFEQDDVQDVAEWLFETLASVYNSEHWNLTEAQSLRLAKPATKLLNAMWARLQTRLPDTIANWLQNTPGAMALIVAAGFIVIPRVQMQMALNRERKAAKPLVQETRSPQPVAPRPTPPPSPARSGIVIE